MFDASIPQENISSSISMDSNGFYQFYRFYPSFSLGRTSSISDFAAPKAERMPQAFHGGIKVSEPIQDSTERIPC
jgi:hypothetical protein